MKQLVIFIPTLNESGTIELLLEKIHLVSPSADILVVDDNSNDGTQEILKNLQKVLPLEVINRPGKMGIGTAHIEALNYAKNQQYKLMISMDADGAHDPKFIPAILAALDNSDLVVGSRYMQTDSLDEWSSFRKLLTHSVHLMTRISLGLRHDSSSGFRGYKISQIPEVLFSGLRSEGYDFFFESMYEMSVRKLRINEVSIVLPARTYGHSKMTLGLVLVALRTLLIVTLRRLKRIGRNNEEQ
jgi:dolichol-phosphate mannosyltransferase